MRLPDEVVRAIQIDRHLDLCSPFGFVAWRCLSRGAPAVRSAFPTYPVPLKVVSSWKVPVTGLYFLT